MSPITVHNSTSNQSCGGLPSLGYDFALLGLNACEARVEVIRGAAVKTAARIQAAADYDQSERDVLLSDLVSSTYRLLDPRRRRRMLERVQLSIYSERDLELQRDSRTPLLATSTLEPASSLPPNASEMDGDGQPDDAHLS